MNQLVNFPSIFCQKHPKYQLNMVCRLESCPLKGAICCRCQLSQHCGGEHTFDSFVPLDEVIIMAQEVDQSSILEYEECLEQLLNENQKEFLQINQQYHLLHSTLQQQFRSEYIVFGEFMQQYKDLINVLYNMNGMQLNIEETPTDEGNGNTIQDLFLDLMRQISQKIKIKDGEFCFDKSDIITYTKRLIARKTKNLNTLKQVLFQTQDKMQQINKLIQTGCTFGIDSHLPLQQFINQWKIIYDQPYSSITQLEQFEQLGLDNIICVAEANQSEILLCIIVEYNKDLVQDKGFGLVEDGIGVLWYLDGRGGGMNQYEIPDLEGANKTIKQLREELTHYKTQLSKLSIEKDEAVFEQNKLIRQNDRLQLQIKEKDFEIQALKERIKDQQQNYTKQLDLMKKHYEYLKDSAIVRVHSEIQTKTDSDQLLVCYEEMKEMKRKYSELLLEYQDTKTKQSGSYEETRPQSLTEVQKLQLENHDLQQKIEEMKCNNSQELIEEIVYLKTQLQQLSEQLEEANRIIEGYKQIF